MEVQSMTTLFARASFPPLYVLQLCSQANAVALRLFEKEIYFALAYDSY